MLPPRALNTQCLRCRADFAPDATHCAACGADRELELSIARELLPAIASLRRWLGLLAGLSAFGAILLLGQFRSWPAAGPLLVQTVVLLGLAAAAGRAPLAVCVIAGSAFAGELGLALIREPWSVFAPGLPLVMRILFGMTLVVAFRAALRARRLRAAARERMPRAVAVVPPATRRSAR
jgi:hypothetical protein